jgi:Ca-activated chloride channel family protein
MRFAAPLILIALVAIPVLALWYWTEQRRRERGAAAFVAPALSPSVLPHRPGWRRHGPIIAVALALIALIFAAARPQRTVAEPLEDGAVMLVNDTSSSMEAKDLKPSRLGAAEKAAQQFIAGVPSTLRVGLIAFNGSPTLLQTPSTDHSLASQALTQLHATGHTAIGDALVSALRSLTSLRSQNGKRLPSAIVLISDGYSTNGTDPLLAARQAKADHIPIDTVALGTDKGTIDIKRHGKLTPVVVPPSPQALGQIATASGGHAFTAGDRRKLSSVYAHLAEQLGHKKVIHEITASLAGGALLLLLLGSGMSLRWFGRLV